MAGIRVIEGAFYVIPFRAFGGERSNELLALSRRTKGRGNLFVSLWAIRLAAVVNLRLGFYTYTTRTRIHISHGNQGRKVRWGWMEGEGGARTGRELYLFDGPYGVAIGFSSSYPEGSLKHQRSTGLLCLFAGKKRGSWKEFLAMVGRGFLQQQQTVGWTGETNGEQDSFSSLVFFCARERSKRPEQGYRSSIFTAVSLASCPPRKGTNRCPTPDYPARPSRQIQTDQIVPPVLDGGLNDPSHTQYDESTRVRAGQVLFSGTSALGNEETKPSQKRLDNIRGLSFYTNGTTKAHLGAVGDTSKRFWGREGGSDTALT